MPLKKIPKGATKKQREKIRSENISQEVRSGKPVKQAVAIAFSEERRQKKKRSGRKRRSGKGLK